MITITKKSKAPPPAPPKLDPLGALKALIEKTIADTPFPFDGHEWCARSQPEIAKALGVSVATLKRRIAAAGIVTAHAHVDGKVTCLMRVGEAGPKGERQTVRHMINIWKKWKRDNPEVADGDKSNKAKPVDITRDEYGMFVGLAGEWGIEKAPDILRLVIREWPTFMAGVNAATPLHEKKLYLKWPTVSVIRKFSGVAVELWNMQEQDKHGLGADYAGGWTPVEKTPPVTVS